MYPASYQQCDIGCNEAQICKTEGSVHAGGGIKNLPAVSYPCLAAPVKAETKEGRRSRSGPVPPVRCCLLQSFPPSLGAVRHFAQILIAKEESREDDDGANSDRALELGSQNVGLVACNWQESQDISEFLHFLDRMIVSH